MSFLQRLKAPFTDASIDEAAETRARQHVIGSALRDRREEFELDLESVGEALCIKPTYLAAIEQGRPQDLPGPAYALGFVRAYAHYLGFDPDEVLEQYKSESAEAQARPDLSLPMPLGARSVPGGAILLVGAILAGCGYGTWYYLSTGERNRPERVAAVPAELQQTLRGAPPVAANPPPASPAAAVAMQNPAMQNPAPPPAAPAVPALVANPAIAGLPGSGTPSSAATPGSAPAEAKAALANMAPPQPSTPTSSATQAEKPAATPAAATPGDAVKSGGRVEIRAIADCWIQVRAAEGDTIVFSRVLKAGETYHVPRPGLLLRTGNAGALTIAVDGKQAPAIGGIGTLRRNVVLDPDPLLAGTAVKG